MPPEFAHLHVHSQYSLLDGLMHTDEIAEACRDMGHTAVALTDHGSLCGMVKFWKSCKGIGIKPIFGCEFYIAKDHRRTGPEHKNRWHLIILASTEEGYQNLIQLSTISFEDGFYYKPRLDYKLLYKYRSGLICLSACPVGEIGAAVMAGDSQKARRIIKIYKDIFGENYYLEMQPHSDLGDYNRRIVALSKGLDVPLVATCDAHFLRPEDHEFHKLLLNIKTKGAFEYHAEEIWLKTGTEVVEAFKGLKLPKKRVLEAMDNAVKIAESIDTIDIDCSQKLPTFEEQYV